jgi:predicted ATPase/DNA-binding SARP family transcriptional activator
LLGPVQAVRGGRELSLGGPKQRAVLALLLLDAGRIVPTEALIEELWRGDPPAGAAKTLRSYLSRLRVVLRPELEIVARGLGYAAELDSGHLDSRRFEGLIGSAQGALEGGAHGVAAERFREALALWRGRALADVGELESLALEAQRLEELRLVALEGRIEAELALGLHAQLVGELERLVGEHPLRERFWRQLVLALYRCERQSEALAAYRRARAILIEQGLEPGSQLRQLEQAVLRHEVPVASPPRVRHNLPAQLTSFLGRERELAELGGCLGEARLITLTGVGGVGKTRLALELAAQVTETFTGGGWLVDLSGISDPGLVPYELMETLGVRQVGGLRPFELLRDRLRDSEILLILDNCEHVLDSCSEIVRALLSASPGLRVLATSREPLGVVGEFVYAVSPLGVPAESAEAESIKSAPSVQLFLERATPSRGRVTVEAEDLATVGRICRELDGLPLAIELAAARTRALAVDEIETYLEDRFRFLRYWRSVAVPRQQTLQATMDWSYELLSDEEQRVLRELSVFAGDFGLAGIADVCSDGDEAAALDLVERLVAKSLVVAEAVAGRTRYRQLETVREYAGRRLAETGEVDMARRRHAVSFVGAAERAGNFSDLVRELDNLRGTLEWAVFAEPELGARLARSLGDFWLMRGLLHEARSWLERLLASSGISEELVAELLGLLGTVLYEEGELDESEAVLSQGLALAMSLRLSALEARLRVRLADTRTARGSIGVHAALQECEAAAALLEDDQDLDSLAEVRLVLGKHYYFLGKSPADETAFQGAAAYAREVGNRRVELLASEWLAVSLLTLRVPSDVAIARQEESLLAVSGERWAEAGVLMPLALSYAYAGRFGEARETLARSRSIFGELGARLEWASGAWNAGLIELLAGDLAAAERPLWEGCDALAAMGERGYLSGILALLAETLYRQGRLGEAKRLTDQAKDAAAPDDIPVQAHWRTTRAKVLAREGGSTIAERLLDEAGAIVSGTAFAAVFGDVLLAKAEVQRLAGALDDAAETLRTALRLYEERKAVPLVDQVQAMLAGLG